MTVPCETDWAHDPAVVRLQTGDLLCAGCAAVVVPMWREWDANFQVEDLPGQRHVPDDQMRDKRRIEHELRRLGG